MYAVFLYDATYLYLSLLNETIALGNDVSDGRDYLQRAKSTTMRGMTIWQYGKKTHKTKTQAPQR